MASSKMHEIECPICRRVVASGPNEAGVESAAAAHQKKAHPKEVKK